MQAHLGLPLRLDPHPDPRLDPRINPRIDSPRSSPSSIPAPLRLSDSSPFPPSGLDRVRDAAAAFIRGTSQPNSWTRRDLAEWLLSRYAPCTSAPLDVEISDESPPSERTHDDAMLARVVLDARSRTLRLLGQLVVPWQASPVARLAVACGTVISERDARGGVAYAPVGLKKMRLSERVASLFIADYLNRSTDYRWLMLCDGCGELAFATELEHAPHCNAGPDQWRPFTPAEAISQAVGD